MSNENQENKEPHSIVTKKMYENGQTVHDSGVDWSIICFVEPNFSLFQLHHAAWTRFYLEIQVRAELENVSRRELAAIFMI